SPQPSPGRSARPKSVDRARESNELTARILRAAISQLHPRSLPRGSCPEFITRTSLRLQVRASDSVPRDPQKPLLHWQSSGMAANALTAVNLSALTEDRGVRECLQWFTREKQWINEIHLQLCRIPSPTFL